MEFAFYFVLPFGTLIKTTPLKKTIVSLLIGSLVLAACSKEADLVQRPLIVEEACIPQFISPGGHSYDKDSVVSYECNSKFCGLMPISPKNYWIYLDSVYNDGVFVKTQYDTLRFTESYRSVTDGLTWWTCPISIGLPTRLYVNDSAIFKLEDRVFNSEMIDAKREYTLFEGDSLRYLTSFDDAAAAGRALKLSNAVSVPAGSYSDCMYFEKNARSYRLDQVYFKPGIGVLRYVQQKVPMGGRDLKLQQVSTLVKFYFK